MAGYIHVCLAGLFFAAMPVNAFFPNRLANFDIGKDTITLEEITQVGILKAVAHYFEDNPRDGNHISPGDLVNMNGLTAANLFKRYYGEEGNAKSLQNVIDNIAKHNSQTYPDHLTNAVWNWNGEMIKEANGLLTSLRENIRGVLIQPDDRFETAYQMIGQYLYILQMFYSNTNWVEMFGSDAYYSLGIHGKPLYAQASQNIMTCKNCGDQNTPSCNGTLIDNGQVLTSGYRSGQNIVKPNRDPSQYSTGKCSHGGRFDVTSTTVAATGGINKDSTVESLSPHFYLHHQAAQAAINHTVFFFNDKVYGLRAILDTNKYERFLQLRAGKSMVFVVDYTGSMSPVINQVKAQILKIIRDSLGTPTEPSDYIFVLFNDPENLTKTFQTKDSKRAMEYTGAIVVGGGGDCPEYSMSGIVKALKISVNPDIYVFTDASAKDADKAPLVMKLAEDKHAKLQFVLTGDCGARKRRNILEELRNDGPQRSKRTVSGVDLYKALATSTGGSTYQTDKGGITQLANVISEVAVTTAVTLIKREVQPGSGNIHIAVDNTITQLTLSITGTGTPTLHEEVYNPNGVQQTANVSETDLGVGKLVKITSPSPGIWRLSGLDSATWNVDITALSSLDITTKFVQLDPVSGFEYQIKGRPIAGKEATIILTVPSAELIRSVDYIKLMDSDGTEIAQYGNFTVIPGRANSSMYRTNFQLPLKQFQVGIWGKDSAGNIFTRLHTRKIVPVAIQLDVEPVDETLYISESVTISYTVTNEGDATSDITVTIEDDKMFSQAPLSHVYHLDPHARSGGEFTLTAGSAPHVLVTATITATALSSTGDNSQFHIVRLSTKTRIDRPTDTINPVCNITSMTGICDEKMVDPCVCSQYKWTATAEIWDEGFGLYQVSSSMKGGDTFTHEAFAQGQTVGEGTVKANLLGSCCNRLIYINVVDMASNTGRCVFHVSPDVLSTSTECKSSQTDNSDTISTSTLAIIVTVAGVIACLLIALIVVCVTRKEVKITIANTVNEKPTVKEKF